VKVPLSQGSYEARGPIASAERCWNLYPEPNPKDSPFPLTHYNTPGLQLVADWSATIPGYVRGLYWASNDTLWAVIGTAVGWIGGGWTWNHVGDLPFVSNTPISMSDNGLTLFMVDGSPLGGWTVDLTSLVFAPCTDPAFYGANRVDFIDTFFIFNNPGTPQFYISNSLDITFNPLYFADKEGYNDLLVSLAALHDNIWLFGATTTEIWFNSGAPDFPFQRQYNSILQQGCVAPYSVVVADNAVFWLSQDRHGRNMLMRGEGYAAKRVSNFAVEDAWAKYQFVNDCIGLCYQEGGHEFIVLQFPYADETWVYDASTGMWHQRVYSPGGVDRWWLPYCLSYWNNGGLVNAMVAGSSVDAKLYLLTRTATTDDGVPIKRVRAWPHVMNDQKRLVHSQFAAALQPGALNPDGVSLRWSDDGGQTFGTPLMQTTNNASNGQYSWRRLGMARDRVYELSWTAAGETALNGAWLEAEPAET
jgi:hypothetical protein